MPELNVDWTTMQKQFRAALKPAYCERLAKAWGVSTSVLKRLGIGWSDYHRAYTFPERDHRRRIIGILLRNGRTGEKRMIPGSKRGVYYFKRLGSPDGPILIPEGVSDVAVLAANGIAAIGRPSSTTGIEVLVNCLINHPQRPIIVVGENDEKENGRCPGRDGAKRVAERLCDRLGREVMWAMPPSGCKDAREYFQERMSHGGQ